MRQASGPAPVARRSIGMLILIPVFAQEPPEAGQGGADCDFFGPKHDRFASRLLGRKSVSPHQQQVSEMTSAVAAVLPKVVAGSRTATGQKESTIDYYLFGAMQNAGVTPAPSTSDYGRWVKRRSRRQTQLNESTEH